MTTLSLLQFIIKSLTRVRVSLIFPGSKTRHYTWLISLKSLLIYRFPSLIFFLENICWQELVTFVLVSCILDFADCTHMVLFISFCPGASCKWVITSRALIDLHVGPFHRCECCPPHPHPIPYRTMETVYVIAKI